MRRSSAATVPALLRFPPELARQDGWGRLQELSSSFAVVSTLTSLERRERVLLSFEVAGEKYRELPAEVVCAERDVDGYVVAELRFLDEVERRRLARTLLEVLSR
jgi:hypothetical protein